MSPIHRSAAMTSGVFFPARATGRSRLQQAELEDTLRSAMVSGMADEFRPLTVVSAQRADGCAAVVLAGRLNGSAMRAVSAHLRGLLDAGPRHLVVDVSQVDQMDSPLPGLLRRVEARMADLGGVVELTGLGPRLLRDLDDDPLARVFAMYRAAFDRAEADEVSWARMRCPDGLDEVAEPRTAARHRAIIDNGTSHPAPPPASRPAVRVRVGSDSIPLPGWP